MTENTKNQPNIRLIASPDEFTGGSKAARLSDPHVLLVLDQFPRMLGGGERVVLQLASLLPQYGYRVSILALGIHPESLALNSVTCPIYLLPLNRTYDLEALRAGMALMRFLKKQNVAIVQTFFESSDLWVGFITKAFSDAKLIWSRRDMGILRTRKHKTAYRLMSRLPDAVFAVSEQVRQHCILVDGIDPRKVFTVYNSLDLPSWITTSRSVGGGQRIHITTVGNVRRVKGHDLLIRAAATIVRQYPNVEFSIAGAILEDDYFNDLKDLVKGLELSGHITFAGNIADIRKHLSTADIFVLPSRSEGFSNAIIEAMGASLPVVATDVGGNAEAVIDGVTGYVVRPEDPDALSAAITRLLADPARARSMGIAGRAAAAEKFTVEALMKQTTEVYEKVLLGH